MPRGDGTGPMGMGPMTGRAAGYCAGYPVPGYMNPTGGRWAFGPARAPFYGAAPYAGPYMARPYGYGAGWGFGRGLGMGFRRGFGRGFGMGFGRGRGWGRGRWFGPRAW